MSLETNLVRIPQLRSWTALGAILLVACVPGPSGYVPEAGAGATCTTGSIMPAGGDDGGASVPATPWLHVEGSQIKDPQGNVVILRGVAFPDLGELASWEGGINAMIDRVTDGADTQGCSPSWQTRVLRLTVLPADSSSGTTPSQYQPGGTYYDAILRPTVDYARGKGLYVIIDWHHIDDTSKHQATTTQFWTDIAPRFAQDSNVLFELYNEPINDGDWTTLKPVMQSWYDVVHAAAPNNLVLVGTPNWCQNVDDAAISPLDGTNIVYVAHMYPLHWGNPFNRSQIQSAAALVPVFMTEWGFQQGDNSILDGTITSYGAPFKQFVEKQKLSWTAWCASTSWQPTMFATDLSLNTGEGEMGGFTKDWLYEKRASDQPLP